MKREWLMKGLLVSLWRDESGVTAIEYGLIAGLMAALLIGALSGFGDKLSDLFSAMSEKLGSSADKIRQSGSTEP